MKFLMSTLLVACGLVFDPSSTIAAGPKNLILIIGDGMDDQQITIARNYLKGIDGRLLLDNMPVRGIAQVQTVENGVDGKPVYVADSANSGTSLATGTVTSMGRISTSPADDDLVTIAEKAKARGLKTGIVTTASVTDATPSVFMAHISLRVCENPDMMVNAKVAGKFIADCSPDLKSNGGLGSISEQIASSEMDIVLGGGASHFDIMSPDQKSSVLEQARSNNFTIVSNEAELKNINREEKVLGLFGPDTLPVRMRAENDRATEKPEPSFLNHFHMYLGEVTLPETMKCEKNPEFQGVPDLQTMTKAALTHLDNENGFFLMVESASIDKQSHLRRPCGSIGELEQLEEALQVALDFAQTHPGTLILVTADHGQAAQIIPETSMFSPFGVPVFTRGHMARIETPEGGIMGINYATNDFSIEEHTGVAIPVFGNETAVGLLPPMVTQVELNKIMSDYLQLSD